MSTAKNNPNLVGELTDEDLMDLALGIDKQIVFDRVSEAGKFVYGCGIKHGKAKIRPYLIYHEYKIWKEAARPEAKMKFFRDFKKYFQPERDKDGLYYLLNEKPFDTSEENYWHLRNLMRREKSRKKSK